MSAGRARLATTADVVAVADAITAGFLDNEIWVWMVPSERRRERLLRRYYRTALRHLHIPRGTAWTVPGAAGGALWFPPGELDASPLHRLRELVSMLPWAGFGGLARGAEFEALQRQHHPSQPHWYLETLSIAPAHQRSGHGSALLEPMLARCDSEATPVYLETQREANVPYYARFGFDLTGEVSTRSSPPLWLMWRPPRRSGPAGR